MARGLPVQFKMYFKVEFETIIRGHHVYKGAWSPVMDQLLECKPDTCAVAKRKRCKRNWCLLDSKRKRDACWTCSHETVTS